jgi:hypothetical protein
LGPGGCDGDQKTPEQELSNVGSAAYSIHVVHGSKDDPSKSIIPFVPEVSIRKPEWKGIRKQAGKS